MLEIAKHAKADLFKEILVAVEIFAVEKNIVLRSYNSELLILPEHVETLYKLKKPKEFSEYFLSSALLNRSARKLFLSWVRKDKTIWPRMFELIQKREEENKDT
jgi:hypothetical protein